MRWCSVSSPSTNTVESPTPWVVSTRKAKRPTCHLPNYAGQQQMPRLAAQQEDYLAHSMREFRDNKVQGRDTMMNRVLRGFSDRDIADMAHYAA